MHKGERYVVELKRNFISIIYTVVFFALMCFGVFQTANFMIFTASNMYMIAGGVVLGLIFYMIIAFLLKEKGFFGFFNKFGIVTNLLEIGIVLGGIIFYSYLLYKSINWTIFLVLLLLLFSTYACSRFIGGRLCGILSFILTMFIMIRLDIPQTLPLQDIINVLCFLIPCALFTAFHRIMIPAMERSYFLIITGCLVTSFVFALGILINPFVSVLFIGCILSLIFAKTTEAKVKLVNGVYLSGIFLLGTIVCFSIFCYIMPELITVPSWYLDNALHIHEWSSATLYLVFDKYTKPIIYFTLPFYNGILPIVLFFFSAVAAYYALRKKTSYMYPVVFSFVCLWGYYILFCEGGSSFSYMTFFLPILAAYGITNTLIEEKITVNTKNDVFQEEAPNSLKKISEEAPVEIQEETQENIPKEEAVSTSDKTVQENDIPEWTISESFIKEQQKQEEILLPDDVMQEDVLPLSDDVMQDDSLLLPENVIAEEDSEHELEDLLERLDMSEPIKRMNETAQEDIADVIERDGEQIELSEALPLKPSKSTLPKYKKPEFDMHIEPVTIPLDDSYSNISEYDEVPTVHELESRWKENEPVIETIATTISETKDYEKHDSYNKESCSNEISFNELPLENIHSENIIKKNGVTKRSYHKITIR